MHINWVNVKLFKREINFKCTTAIFTGHCVVKATFSFHKLISQKAQMTTLYSNW